MGQKRKKHPYLGYLSKHHLIPRQRLKDYYGNSFRMGGNILRLWRLRHDAWHVLFQQKTLNEIINYLHQRSDKIYGYQTPTWNVLFKSKTKNEAIKLLCRVRKIIRKKYAFLEFDPSLRAKVRQIEKVMNNKIFARIYLDKRFKPNRT